MLSESKLETWAIFLYNYFQRYDEWSRQRTWVKDWTWNRHLFISKNEEWSAIFSKPIYYIHCMMCCTMPCNANRDYWNDNRILNWIFIIPSLIHRILWILRIQQTKHSNKLWNYTQQMSKHGCWGHLPCGFHYIYTTQSRYEKGNDLNFVNTKANWRRETKSTTALQRNNIATLQRCQLWSQRQT